MSVSTLLMGAWNLADEDAKLSFLRELAIPFPANSPIECAKQAILNLKMDELEAFWDWMGETHQLPPGVN